MPVLWEGVCWCLANGRARTNVSGMCYPGGRTGTQNEGPAAVPCSGYGPAAKRTYFVVVGGLEMRHLCAPDLPTAHSPGNSAGWAVGDRRGRGLGPTHWSDCLSLFRCPVAVQPNGEAPTHIAARGPVWQSPLLSSFGRCWRWCLVGQWRLHCPATLRLAAVSAEASDTMTDPPPLLRTERKKRGGGAGGGGGGIGVGGDRGHHGQATYSRTIMNSMRGER